MTDQEQHQHFAFHEPLTPMQEQCYALLQAKQYKSCELLARLELSHAEQQGRDLRVIWALLGECAQATQQYRKAVSFYRKINQFSGYQDSVSPKYRLKEAQCLSAVGNVVEASSVLERVPPEARTLTIHMTLGQLYLASGRSSSASECFLDSLVQNPYALEAMESLAILGTDMAKVVDAIKTGFAQQQTNDSSKYTAAIQDLVTATFAKHRHQASSALEMFQKLSEQFPNNVQILLKIATLQVSTLSPLRPKLMRLFLLGTKC